MHSPFDALALVVVAASNGVAWFSDVDMGKIVSSLSVLVIGVMSLALFVGGKVNKYKDETAREKAKRENDAAVERARVELEIRLNAMEQEQAFAAKKAREDLALQAERDKANQASLAAQVEKLQASMDEARKRVEDANQKLHDQNNKWNADRVQHQAEMDELRGRHEQDVASFKQQLTEATAEIHDLRTENRAYRSEISELMKRIAVLQSQANATLQGVRENTAKITDLQSQADDLAGRVPA